MRRPVLTTFLIFSAFFVVGVLYVDRRGDFREARWESSFPPQGKILNVQGRDLHVVVEGEGPDLILIHGAGGSTRDMTSSLGKILSSRYRVFTVDRPGFGWSDRADAAYHGALAQGFETPVEQAALLSEAVQKLGATKPIVVGHSYGGAVAMAWALDQPAAGVVIISGATMPWPGDVDITYRALASKPGAAVGAPLVTAFIPDSYVLETLEGIFDPQEPPGNYVNRAAVPLALRTGTLRANAQQVNGLRPEIVQMSRRYSEITMPIEILHGTADKTVYPEVHAEPLHAILPNSELTLLNGIGHMPHHVATEEVIAAIDRAAKRAGLR